MPWQMRNNTRFIRLPFSAWVFFSSTVELMSWTSQYARISRQRNVEFCPNCRSTSKCQDTDLNWATGLLSSIDWTHAGRYTPRLSAPRECWDFPFCHCQCPDANSRSSQGGRIACPQVVLHPSVLHHLGLLPQSLSVRSYTWKHTQTQIIVFWLKKKGTSS